MSQQEQSLEQIAILAEDELLRQWGHPQQHLYSFRAAGLTYQTMALLPAARSTGEAEFYALSSLAQEAVYLQMFVGSLHIPTSVFEIFSNDKSRYQTDSSKPAHLFDTAV